MKKFIFSATAILISLSCNASFHLNLKFATKAEAQKYILEQDHYTKGWSQFDIDSRLGKVGGTRQDLQALQQKECRDFTKEEHDSVAKVFSLLEEKMNAEGLTVPAPEEIVLIKTTMHEEGDAGAYTRNNKIYIGESLFRIGSDRLMNIMAHELFHVLTRNSIPFKRAVYTTIGFTVMDNEVNFPEYILTHRISNPDVSLYDSYAIFSINGEDVPCTMINYFTKDYNGGSFFNYLEVGLVALDKNHQPIIKDGQPVIYSMKDATDFDQQLGKNTGYVINPEECLADNFAMTVTGVTKNMRTKEPLPNLELLKRIHAVLSQKW